MSTLLVYRFAVKVPDVADIPPEIVAEIAADAEPHDGDFAAKVRRYLGADIERAEDALEAKLPDGWSVYVTEGGTFENV